MLSSFIELNIYKKKFMFKMNISYRYFEFNKKYIFEKIQILKNDVKLLQ